MTRAVARGANEFEDLRASGDLLVDKTALIGAWWHARHKVTLVCRPRGLGKTLTLSMVRRFLSVLCDRDETAWRFEGLDVTEDDRTMALMSCAPVVSVSLADVRDPTCAEAVEDLRQVLSAAVEEHAYLMDSGVVGESDKRFLARVSDDLADLTAKSA